MITATGARGVVGAADLPLLADGAVLMNVGHFPREIDVPAIRAAACRGEPSPPTASRPSSSTAAAAIQLLTGGHMVNLAGPRPLGNSIESMDLGFALQARCLEAVARGDAGPADCVVPVPRAVDEAVASAYVKLAARRAADPGHVRFRS